MPGMGKLARNGPQGYYMSCYSEDYPLMAIFDAAQLILDNSVGLSLNCLRTSFNEKKGRHCTIRPLMVQYDLI